jgi:hypothetical protein
MSLLCENESSIKTAIDLVQPSKTKYIDIQYHFIRYHQAKGDITIKSVDTIDQLANIFTNPLDDTMFCKLHNGLNMFYFSKYELIVNHMVIMPLLRLLRIILIVHMHSCLTSM